MSADIGACQHIFLNVHTNICFVQFCLYNLRKHVIRFNICVLNLNLI